MIKWVNKKGIPEPIAIAMIESTKQYDGGPITPFLSSSKMKIESKEYYLNKVIFNEDTVYERDISDMYYVFVGNAIHNYMETMLTSYMDREKSKRFSLEQRLYCDIDVDGTMYTIGGQYDCLDMLKSQRKLIDFKTASVAKYSTGLFEDYELQANIYLYMLRHGYIMNKSKEIKYLDGFGEGYKASLNFILRDWSNMRTNTHNYPSTGMQEFVLPVWTDKEVVDFISKRIRLLLVDKDKPVEEIPECSPEKRWQDPDKYPVFMANKDGKPKAKLTAVAGTKDFLTKQQAEAFIKARKESAKTKAQKTSADLLYVGYRESTPTYCLEFCTAGKVGACNWLNKWKKSRE